MNNCKTAVTLNAAKDSETDFQTQLGPNIIEYHWLTCVLTYSYGNTHVSQWVSLLLILSGDISINPSPNTNPLTGSMINIRSIRNKSVAFAGFINSDKSDAIAITETWLQSDDTDSFIVSVTPLGYKCTHVLCPEGRGGGAGFFICDDIDFKVLLQPCFKIFESISVHLPMGNAKDFIFHTVYRPSNISKANFIEDFSSSVDVAALSCWENIILGDLNLNLDKQDSWSQKFNDHLCQYNFTQNIDSPTHTWPYIRCHMFEGHLLTGGLSEGYRGSF